MPLVDGSDYLLSTLSKDAWKRIGTRRRAGVQLPLFSLYSRQSQGIGDLADLRLAVDWCASVGLSIIQLLPMNEVGPGFCPYDSLSSVALEPMYLSLKEIRTGNGEVIDREALNTLIRRFPPGPGKQYIDYTVKEAKLKLLWEFYRGNVYGLEGVDFEEFRAAQEYWLEDFALFKVLKDHHHGAAWFDWEEPYKNRDLRALEDFRRGHTPETTFQMWLQWQLFLQMGEARDYANRKNVFLKGDLPILVSRDSSDAWAHPEFFKLDFASGAPPDMYCAKGQRWGMPTYRWDNIAADGYRYVKKKLQYAQAFYDIGRVDHVVGLFRIWSIPYNDPQENQGLNGAYDPADKGLWGEQGRRLLSVMLESTDMLLCAEDLGTIPDVCVQTLKEYGIPGNDVQRWVKDWKTAHDFLPPQEYRHLAVAMLSTHDTTNWPACWRYEIGTVDEALFARKCGERGIDYAAAKEKLIDAKRSWYGRLRWLEEVESAGYVASALGRRQEDLLDFIEMYENSYLEKEKLWKRLGLQGPMREECDPQILLAALRYTLASEAVFCIETIIDWLYTAGVFKGDPYQFRINFPGTISGKNWSLCLPVSLDELIGLPANDQIRRMVKSAGRGT